MGKLQGYTQAQADMLRYTFSNGKVTRAQLVEALGVSNLTVINGVKRLLDDGVLADCGTLPSDRGRRVTLLSVNPELHYFLCVDIGASSTKIAVVRFDGSVIHREQVQHIQTVFSVYITPQDLRKTISRILQQFGKDRFSALCFCISGTVDFAAKRCLFCSNIQGWNDVDFQKEFGDFFQMPVYLDSSGHCAAMAERQFGKAKGLNDVLFISVGTTIRTGIITGGKVLRGTSGAAGEFGHIQLSEPAPLDWICTCGKQNCLEMYVTFSVLRRQIYGKVKHTIPGWTHSSAITREMTEEIYKSGHPAALEVINNAGQVLGRQIANVASLLNPRMIVLGGGTIYAFPRLVDVVREQVQQNCMPLTCRELTVEQTALGSDAPVQGAALLAIFDLLRKTTDK